MSTTVLTEPEMQPGFPPDDTAVCPAQTPLLSLVGAPALRFAHAPAAPGPSVQEISVAPVPLVTIREEVPARQRQAITARRRARLDWDAILVILLMLACAAVGVYRLLWMGQI